MAGWLSSYMQPSTGMGIGNSLSDLGAGLLAYGAGRNSGEGGYLALQALQGNRQARQQYQLGGLQQQALKQQINQGGISNALGNASALLMLNARRAHFGQTPLTQQDLENNPELITQAFSAASPSSAPVGVQTPQPVPQGGMLQSGANYQQPQMGNGPGMLQQGPTPQGMPPQTGGLLQNGGQVDPNDPYGITAATDIGWAGDPKLSQVLLNAAQANPAYVAELARQKSLADKLLQQQNGVISPMAGSIPSQAALTGANAGATARAQLPSELTKIGATGAEARKTQTLGKQTTPTTIPVAEIGRDGKPTGRIIQKTTSEYTAATGGGASGITGMELFTPGQTSVQNAQGTVQGTTAATLPSTISAADDALKLIGQLQTDPAKADATGLKGLFLSRIPATAAYGYSQKVDQLKGNTFLQAYNRLKGAGAISEVEGTKAENAIARLNTAQDTADFTQALDDLKGIIIKGKENFKKQASGDVGVSIPGAAPPPAVPIQKWGRDSNGNPVPLP